MTGLQRRENQREETELVKEGLSEDQNRSLHKQCRLVFATGELSGQVINFKIG